MSVYKLNPEEAKKGDKSNGARISESGAYKGVFTLVHEIKSKHGSTGIEFLFKDESDREATMQIYVTGRDGQPIYGAKVFQAVMAVMKIREAATQQMLAELYDFDSGGKKKQMVEALPALINKPIGLVLQKENFIKDDGSIGYSMKIFCPFNAETEQTATETLNQLPAQALHNVIAACKDVDQKPQGKSHHQQSDSFQQPAMVDDFEDDIPF